MSPVWPWAGCAACLFCVGVALFQDGWFSVAGWATATLYAGLLGRTKALQASAPPAAPQDAWYYERTATTASNNPGVVVETGEEEPSCL